MGEDGNDQMAQLTINGMRKGLILAVALGLSGCNSVSLSNLIPKSDPAPAKPASASQSGEDSSGFSFKDILYGGAKPPSRVITDDEDPPECPSPTFTAEDSVIRQGGDVVKSQISIVNTARECAKDGKNIRIHVGVEARVLLGPAGTSGTYTAPVSITLLRGTKVVASRVTRGSVTLANGQAQGSIVMVERDIIVPQGAEELVIQLSLKGSGGETSASSAKKKR
jgi:hypothetical protein